MIPTCQPMKTTSRIYIQRRMRANSATVPKTCAWVSTVDAKASTWIKQMILNDPKRLQNGPQMDPQMNQMGPKWIHNCQGGAKMSTRGPQRDQGRQMMEKGPPKGGPRRERPIPLGDKKRSKSINKRV